MLRSFGLSSCSASDILYLTFLVYIAMSCFHVRQSQCCYMSTVLALGWLYCLDCTTIMLSHTRLSDSVQTVHKFLAGEIFV